jgi:hypothetical protein
LERRVSLPNILTRDVQQVHVPCPNVLLVQRILGVFGCVLIREKGQGEASRPPVLLLDDHIRAGLELSLDEYNTYDVIVGEELNHFLSGGLPRHASKLEDSSAVLFREILAQADVVLGLLPKYPCGKVRGYVRIITGSQSSHSP